MAEIDPDIDLKRITFPSDKISIKKMRTIYPEKFDTRDIDVLQDDAYDKLAEMIFNERTFAINVYDQARGSFRDDGLYGQDLKIVRKDLAALYTKLGLAAGPAHAKELVRAVEGQALQQAKQHGGKGR